MSDKKIVYLRGPTQKQVAHQYIEQAEQDWIMRLSPPTRTLEQNAKLWPMLNDVSKQVNWYGQHLSDEEWKDVFTAALKKQKVVPGIDGGFVVLGHRTSTMPKSEFSDLIELIYSFGCDHLVKWSEPAMKSYQEGAHAA